MYRRGFLATVAATPVALAGCGSSGGPVDQAAAFLQAFYNGNVNQVHELTHPDGPASQEFSSGVFVPPEGDVEITDGEVVEEGESSATIRITHEEQESGEQDSTWVATFEMRTHDDSWRVWDVTFEQTE